MACGTSLRLPHAKQCVSNVNGNELICKWLDTKEKLIIPWSDSDNYICTDPRSYKKIRAYLYKKHKQECNNDW